MGQTYSQALPPPAKLTEKNLPDQSGKVFLITGATSGLGKELATILFGANAKVWLAARSSEKATRVMNEIRSRYPDSGGELQYLHLDLDDLSTIKSSTEEFLSKEQKLHVLWNNAGVMIPPKGSKTTQGHELQLGTNAIAPFLFTKLLTPLLISTAHESASGDVRVVWLSSSMVEGFAPEGGVDMNNLDYKTERNAMQKYAVSKAGNILYSAEMARRYGGQGIVSVSLDPGNLKTDLQRHASSALRKVWGFVLHRPIYGAYTELFAGLSPDVAERDNNAWIVPWGRFGSLRKDIGDACKTKEDGGSGIAQQFWDWSENELKPYF
ncbi:hypothetical protein DL764_000391 [Monosporascus ibericus]|uniref:Short-chain dehydrogenase n=1 Tax=Monosporascus ibericus TaxID=155417 RepID=A0A4V1XCT2_9PEZI|nr:hypothetical protein DL764_000391 [Monosporascus ibericus]